jgi:oxygen-independent coproporphyrinogen-3 oxidase
MRSDLAACYGQERLPRYTSYPTASHFSSAVSPDTYAAALRCEIDLVSRQADRRIQVDHIHFGGGTPTIMAPELFTDLIGSIRHSFFVLPSAEIAVEIDPRTLTRQMIDALAYGGVNRASLGVQSFDPVVQRAINRVQGFYETAVATLNLRRAGIAASISI